ncbi:MAG: valine--tRNA ligase [bacterium]
MTKIQNLPEGAYRPEVYEEEILKFWLDNKFYKPEYDSEKGLMTTDEMKKDIKEKGKKTFSMVLPPPNANGELHCGHVSGYSYMDLLGRFHRMNGEKVILIPGKDHAGILTEMVYEKELQKKGSSKRKLGREEFYKQCYEYSTLMAKNASENEKSIGLSADFDRDIFTLDPDIVKIVLETFINLYNDKLIYKGTQIVNWDPKAQSTLADIDTERQAVKGKLCYIKYSDEITVATTRPETLFGDTAVAVNPTDERYKKLIGTKIKLPLTNREIPIIYSPRIEKEFGTGCLKVTPAHAPDDYTIMNEWNIEAEKNGFEKIGYVNVIDKYAKLLPMAGEFAGMKTSEAREKVVAKLKELGLLTKEEEIDQNIVVGERSKAVIEPIMSRQWFVDVKKLKEKALEVVKSKKVTIHPENMHEKLTMWLENLRDWPISRSLWWGYRIPVWYKGDINEYYDENGQFVSVDPETKIQLECPGEGWKQDEDVLDTWFSSGQWAYATLMKTNLFDTFYPTQVMVNAHDILELWDSRMIMLSLYRTGEIPFKDVYLTGLVKARDGQKMSKSKGNGVSPIELYTKYGKDATRMFYYHGNSAGRGYPISDEKLLNMKKFANKIWNASRFVLIGLQNEENLTEDSIRDKKNKVNDETYIQIAKEMEAKVSTLRENVIKKIDNLTFGYAAEDLYESFWHDFCDIYIEKLKAATNPMKGEYIVSKDGLKEINKIILESLKTYLKLLHPFMPFITEKIWQYVPSEGNTMKVKTIMFEKI